MYLGNKLYSFKVDVTTLSDPKASWSLLCWQCSKEPSYYFYSKFILMQQSLGFIAIHFITWKYQKTQKHKYKDLLFPSRQDRFIMF